MVQGLLLPHGLFQTESGLFRVKSLFISAKRIGVPGLPSNKEKFSLVISSLGGADDDAEGCSYMENT